MADRVLEEATEVFGRSIDMDAAAGSAALGFDALGARRHLWNNTLHSNVRNNDSAIRH